MNKTKMSIFILSIFLLLTVTTIAQSIEIQTSSNRTRIYETFLINWSLKSGHNSSEVEYRYKLDMPGDWLGGIQYAIKKWSDWTEGKNGNLTYSNFVVQGKYTFSVECRLKGTQKKIASASKKFDVYWEYPEVQEEAFTINWNRVNAAKSQKEKYSILSEEYYSQYQMWYQRFDYYHKLLKLTKPIDQLINETAKGLVEHGHLKLLEKSAPAAAKVVDKVLLPKTIYDIISSGVTDLILIYRNIEANKASSMTIVSYAAYQYFKNKARS